MLVFLCIKYVPVPHVRPTERFLVGRIGSRGCRIYRCIVRYGYRDFHKDDTDFERDLICSVAEFIRSGDNAEVDEVKPDSMAVVGTCSANPGGVQISDAEPEDADKKVRKRVRFVVPENPMMEKEAVEELRDLMEAREAGMAYIVGHSYVRAKQGSGLLRRVAIDFVYDFLKRNCRAPPYAASVPHASTIEVGMICHL